MTWSPWHHETHNRVLHTAARLVCLVLGASAVVLYSPMGAVCQPFFAQIDYTPACHCCIYIQNQCQVRNSF